MLADARPAAVTAGILERSKTVKFDGYRAIAFKTRKRVHLMSRNGKDFSQRFPALAHALEPLTDETVIDGEIVAFDGSGRPFDLLVLAGQDLRTNPWRLAASSCVRE
jgi:bifunctional non-homologous end joining protein LigD